MDIKIGEIPEWNLMKNGFNLQEERKHLDELFKEKIISKQEYSNGTKLLENLTPLKSIQARKQLRFGILRWTPKDVLKGHLKLRNKKVISLYEAFETSGITKVDVISWSNNKYNEFSNIILWNNYTKQQNPIESIRENIVEYLHDKNYLKVLKRIFSLSKLLEDSVTEEKCISILNSEIGYLYTIVADLEVLAEMKKIVSKIEKKNIEYEMQTLTDRVAKAYFDGNKRPKRASFSLLPKLYSILQYETYKIMKQESLLPVKNIYLP
jgi:hypothetical protein